MTTPQNDYLPEILSVSSSRKETQDIYTIDLQAKNLGAAGQFYMLSLLGIGEAPISVASGMGRKLSFTIRKVGKLTTLLEKSDKIGVRGPYGNSWPWKEFDEIVAVAGGIGIPPIRSLVEEMIDSRMAGRIEVMYGARSPSDLVYRDMIDVWSRDIDVHLTVDRGDGGWTGNVGFVPSLLKRSHLGRGAAVFVIGPPLMMMNTVKEALNLGYREDRIYLSLERRMECGIGVCGHCNVGHYYVCESGPIFNYSDVKDERELFL